MFSDELNRPYGTRRAARCGRFPGFYPGVLSACPYGTRAAQGLRRFRERPWALAGAAVLALLAGCSRPPAAASASTATAAVGPRATLQRLSELRGQQRHRELSGLIVPQHGENVVQFVMAVDEFLTANRRLCDWLGDHAGLGLSQTIDQSYVADDLVVYAGEDLGVFSRHVELLDEAVVADQATVTYTVENRLPAKRARLRQVGSAWRYDPGSACPDELPAAFQDMARGLESLLAELEHGKLDVARLRDDPELLMEKVKARLRRGVGLLSKAQAARGTVLEKPPTSRPGPPPPRTSAE